MYSRQEDTVEVRLAQPSISASQTSSVLQCVVAQSGTRQTMQALKTAAQHSGNIPVSEASPRDRLRARKFQMNNSTLLFTPAKGSCRQNNHAVFFLSRFRSHFKPVSC